MVIKEHVTPSKVGIVVVDMWDYDWCRTAMGREYAMVPRLNAAFDRARSLGMQVIQLPTEVTPSYEGYPQREAVLALPKSLLPKPVEFHRPDQDPRSGGCECGPGPRCMYNHGYRALAPTLRMRDTDLIAFGDQELYNICKARGLTQLLYAGIATNQCLLLKPGALIAMKRYGMKCYVLRDLSDADTEYDPQRGYTPETGNAEVLADIERYIAPSIDFVADLKKAGDWGDDSIMDPLFITPWGRMFEDKVTVTLAAPDDSDAEIRYTLDGTEPTSSSLLYTKPFTLEETKTLKAAGFFGGKMVTLPGSAEFTRLPAHPPKPNVFLSDLKPAAPAINGWPYFRKQEPNADRAIGGSPLRVREEEYKKGLGVHAVSRVVYNLQPEYERFVAVAGLDDEILGEDDGRFRVCYPRVVFEVIVDGKLLAKSPPMRAQYVPWAFDVRIPEGSHQLMLVVTDGRDDPFVVRAENLTFYNYLDHADWLNAGFLVKRGAFTSTIRRTSSGRVKASGREAYLNTQSERQ
jgi:nicotinamidase-related amidase